MRASFTLTGEENAPLRSALDLGDVEHLRSLLLDFRKFTAPKEDLHFPRICNLVEGHVTHDGARRNFIELRRDWTDAEQGGVGVVVNGRPINARGAFDVLVNGRVFHEYDEKARFVDDLPQTMQEMLQYQMVEFVINGIKILVVSRNNLLMAKTPVGF